MKIAIDARFLRAEGSGICRYILELTRNIIKIDEENEYLILVPPGYSGEFHGGRRVEIEITDMPVVDIKQHFSGYFKDLGKKIDLYHYPHFDLPLRTRVSSIITIHDLKYITHPEFFEGDRRLKSSLMKLMMAASIKRSIKVIAVSESTKRDLIGKLKIPEEKIEVIHEAVGDGYHPVPAPRCDEVLKKYGIPPPYILSVGELRPHKNIARLVRAFEKLEGNNHSLVIAGKRYKDYSTPFEIAAKIDPRKKIIFTGLVPEEDLPALYNGAELFVLFSLYEGFGLPVVEAMACGTPVVISNIESLCEVAGGAAMTAEPRSAVSLAQTMGEILNDSNLHAELKYKSLERVKEFSWERAAEETIGVYRKAWESVTNPH